jgi:hypothetical protein
MSRIPAELIESIMRDVPCRQVLEAAGAVFAKHGADVVCPPLQIIPHPDLNFG